MLAIPSAILKYHAVLTSPTEFREIYETAVNALNDVKKKLGDKEIQSTYHLRACGKITSQIAGDRV